MFLHQSDTTYGKLRFTSFPELGIAVVTHFSHPVFEVLQRVSVPGTSAAHHLLREIEYKEGLQTTDRQHPVSVVYLWPPDTWYLKHATCLVTNVTTLSFNNLITTKPKYFLQVCVSDLATGVAVVSSQCEAEVRGTVHAHHHMRNWHQNRSSLTQGHPQLLTGLWTHKIWDKVGMRLRCYCMLVCGKTEAELLVSVKGISLIFAEITSAIKFI